MGEQVLGGAVFLDPALRLLRRGAPGTNGVAVAAPAAGRSQPQRSGCAQGALGRGGRRRKAGRLGGWHSLGRRGDRADGRLRRRCLGWSHLGCRG